MNSLSYRITIIIFFALFLMPVFGLGFLVKYRIEEREIALQRLLQNQIDIDRQIITQRAILRSIYPRIHSYLFKLNVRASEPNFLASIKDDFEKTEKFFKRYENTYMGEQRPFLKSILQKTEEENLVSEEAEIVRTVFKRLDVYRSSILADTPMVRSRGAPEELASFLSMLNDKESDVYKSFDNLADLRYIFGQRIIFSISGENDRQQGFFTAIFTVIISLIFIFLVIQYFFIHKPFKDIMLFLKDLSQGKRGQRLYFSSLIKEIKESEEIINTFVGEAEEHEEHTRKT